MKESNQDLPAATPRCDQQINRSFGLDFYVKQQPDTVGSEFQRLFRESHRGREQILVRFLHPSPGLLGPSLRNCRQSAPSPKDKNAL